MTDEKENPSIKNAFKIAEKKREEEEKEEHRFSPADIARGAVHGAKKILTPVAKETKETGSIIKEEIKTELSKIKPSEILRRRVERKKLEREASKDFDKGYYEGARRGYRYAGSVAGENVIRRRHEQSARRNYYTQGNDFSAIIGTQPKSKNSNPFFSGNSKTNMNLIGGSKQNNNLLSMGGNNHNLLGNGKKKKELRMI